MGPPVYYPTQNWVGLKKNFTDALNMILPIQWGPAILDNCNIFKNRIHCTKLLIFGICCHINCKKFHRSSSWYMMMIHTVSVIGQMFHPGKYASSHFSSRGRLIRAGPLLYSSQVKSSQVVGLRTRVASIRTLIFSSPHPYAGSGEVWMG